MENYRPVSGLSTISKVFERCIINRFSALNFDSTIQHGFCNSHGTVTAGVEVQHHIAHSLYLKKHTILYTVVLGPKLFCIYTKGLKEVIGDSAEVVAYADDSYVICSADSPEAVKLLTEEVLARHLQ